MKIIRLLFFFFCLHSIGDFAAEVPLCISLGCACGPALSLRSLNIRKEAFPFDWTRTPYTSLCNVLQTDFSNFCINLSLLPNHCGVTDICGVDFVHDFPTISTPNLNASMNDLGVRKMDKLVSNWRDFIPAVLAKYTRRIERFREACRGSRKIYFLRHEYQRYSDPINAEQSCFLRDIIKEQYPTLNFELIVIVKADKWVVQTELDNIRYFSAKSWNNPKELKSILTSVDAAFAKTRIIKYLDLECMDTPCC